MVVISDASGFGIVGEKFGKEDRFDVPIAKADHMACVVPGPRGQLFARIDVQFFTVCDRNVIKIGRAQNDLLHEHRPPGVSAEQVNLDAARKEIAGSRD